ncbi:HepT-like ribonuclease domain-containing protein [Parabacteroides sp. merdae-related_45_40]|uniref:HepT-like ribonuclease domain-containing protein n=1 Tax=Parabacteroides sp. merdae-related_45_40 TaxID=1897013 RepID=UPI00338E5741
MKGLRDIVVHHYFEIDIDVVWWILSNELQSLKKAIISKLSDLSEYPLPFSFLLLIETHPVDLHLDRQIR